MKITLNEQQLSEWLKSALFVDSTEEFVDDNGNYEGDKIFEKDGKLWSLEYCNNKPSSRWDDRKGNHGGEYVHGEYDIFEIEAKKEMIEITKYIRK
jgi:hypothetical protein